MFAIRRNLVIISALVVIIGIAGYFNVVDGKNNAGKGLTLNDNGDVTALVPSDNSGSAVSKADNAAADAAAVDDNTAIATSDPSLTEAAQALNQTTQSSGAAAGGSGPAEPGQAVFVSNITDDSYFVQAKLDREQARSKEEDMLMGMINNTGLSQDKRAACADSLLEIQKRIEKETAAEAMIESKGFKGVYVRIDDNTVDVVINKEALTDAEIAQIQDIVVRKTGYDASKIRINPMKKAS